MIKFHLQKNHFFLPNIFNLEVTESLFFGENWAPSLSYALAPWFPAKRNDWKGLIGLLGVIPGEESTVLGVVLVDEGVVVTVVRMYPVLLVLVLLLLLFLSCLSV